MAFGSIIDEVNLVLKITSHYYRAYTRVGKGRKKGENGERKKKGEREKRMKKEGKRKKKKKKKEEKERKREGKKIMEILKN